MLSAVNPDLWKVYDETGDTPNWSAAMTDPSDTNGWGSLNLLDRFNTQTVANYVTGYASFEAAAQSGHLPAVSWLIPPFGLTEWENNHPSDGAYNIALKLNAILSNPDLDADPSGGTPFWDSTVFILVYDENDGHFDHASPPLPPAGVDLLDVGSGPQPIGCGFRVPAIIISPWTFGAGVQTQTFDHTSILQLLEQLPVVNNVPCPNIASWRRFSTASTPTSFGNLATVFDFTAPPVPAATVIAQLPTPGEVLTFKTSAEARYKALGYTDLGLPPTAPPPAPPASPSWLPVAQACELIMTFPSYGQGQVQDQAALQGSSTGPATFDAAMMVVVYGFEPAELSTQYASATLGQLPVGSTGTPCMTRIPTITITDGAGTVLTGDGGPLTVSATSIDSNPAVNFSLPQPNQGVPQNFTFTYSLTFNSNPSNTALFARQRRNRDAVCHRHLPGGHNRHVRR